MTVCQVKVIDRDVLSLFYLCMCLFQWRYKISGFLIYIHLVTFLPLCTVFTWYHNVSNRSQRILRFPTEISVFFPTSPSPEMLIHRSLIKCKVSEILCPKMLTFIKCNLKFCNVYFYTSEGNIGNAVRIWYMIQVILICYLPTRHPWKAGGKLAEACMWVPRIAEGFKAIKKQRVKSSQDVNFFLKFAPLLNFEEIMQSILIFSYQNAYQK